jgi:nucleoside 2-deoxyribosyltransferase
MLRVYLAAPYVAKKQIEAEAAELRALGIEVTSSWLEETHSPTTQLHELTHEEHQGFAVRDVQDVRAADVFVFHTDPTKAIIRGGRHVEFGIAVALHKPILIVGEEQENIFHHLPNLNRVATWEQARAWLVVENGISF